MHHYQAQACIYKDFSYYKPVKCWLPSRLAVSLLGCFLLLVALEAQAKLIHLRNGAIPTKSVRSPRASKGSAEAAASGLYLIQFTGPLDKDSRAQLAALGVTLFHYVPDDAYVARFHAVRVEQLRALPYLHWFGEYRAEHKLHRGLVSASQSNSPVGVAILMVPRANAAEIAQVRGMLSAVHQESSLRAGTVLRGRITAGRLQALARSESVLWIEPYRGMKLFDEVASKIVAGDGGPGVLLPQSLGYDGSGVNVAVADSGLDNGDEFSMHPDLLGRTPAFFYYGNLFDAADEHSHGTHVAGIVAGNGASAEVDDNGALYGLGVAPGANIIAQRIFDGVGNFEAPPSFERLTRDATRAGADIGSNSWGDDTQGRYDISAMEFDELVRDADALRFGDQQYILEFSAGNAGPGSQTVGSPAVAKNVIATGASENDREDFVIYSDGPDTIADFSSRGPCEDGRIKPDIVAPGTWIASLQSQSATDIYAWSPISELYQYQGGTSQAGPHASGAAAVFVQWYRSTHTNATPSPALVKAALINSAYDLDNSFGTDFAPNPDEGWGLIDLTLFFDPALTFRFFDQSVLLNTGQTFERAFVIANPENGFKVTLAYSDPPGFPGALPALVNDLDLEVLGPGGQVYRGNQFFQGESFPNPPAQDNINNVEQVVLSTPASGEYIVRVRARSVVADVHGEDSGLGQDFALVISGELAAPGQGVVAFDRSAYTVPSQIKISMADTDRAGQSSTPVVIRSTTESGGETVSLSAASSSGGFTGTVATATGAAVTDGKLQIAHNDTIEVTYFDASAGLNRTASATADLVAPVLGNPSVTNDFGETSVSWGSSEPATSIVRYGTNAVLSSLNRATTNSDLTTTHLVALEDLIVGRTYYYFVVSSDQAGNTTTNSNGGSFFSFVAPTNHAVLVVDEYQDQFFGAPPISGYTTALDGVGVTYDVWDVGVRGAPPSLNNLRGYRAVIWRVPELTAAWTASEQNSISNYLARGGGLFVASMELMSRLEEVGATNFIRNVLHVQSYVVDPDSTGAAAIIGSSIESVGNGIDVLMDYTVYEDLWTGFIGPDISDTLNPAPGASSILHNDVGDVVGLRWPGLGAQGQGRLVLLSCPLDAVPLNGGVNDRIHLLRNVISFLAPGASGIADVAFDSSAYGLPSIVNVQVGDDDRARTGSLSVTVSSTTEPSGFNLTLLETPNPGVFNGSFVLISSTSPPAAGKLRAKNGDDLTLKYFDASAGSFVSATATVDTNSPTISFTDAEADYELATVYWETSEPADSLVQFGESPLLGRTAYAGDPTTDHAVTLFGLVPDRTYYYKVVSRDIAGNTVTDDNQGNLYTFRTLLPLYAPWSDNMNSGATNWSVFSADDSQSQWTLGVPNNGLETAANSPPAAWGSNLNGQPVDYVETFLISPAIYLTNGNLATLEFWHSYDFAGGGGGGFDIELGEVQIVYNHGTALAPLADFNEFSDSWEKVNINLTPYAGQVVYLIWYYVVFSFDSTFHPGWLIDDVSITVSTQQPGTIQITNNINQATYILSGQMYRKGKGLGTVIPNAPPGPYTLEFADVPYYATPTAQTNTLLSGTTLSFQGDYTFDDTNNNGMSDAWELEFFGSISPTRTPSTDTDGDHMTDLAEFIAGTNPTNAASKFVANVSVLANGAVRLNWQSGVGHGYRVLGSTNLLSWTPFSAWIRASGNTAGLTLPPRTNRAPYLFRIEAKP